MPVDTEDLEVLPFNFYLWKIASRCNINCSYCYVYQRPDQSWRRQPKLMSEEIALRTAVSMREHLERHGKDYATIVFHGGEPMLGGINHLSMLIGVIDRELRSHGIDLVLGMQSNGLLFTEQIGDFMLENKITVGVSLDGPPSVNDLHRVDHQGRPTGARLEEKLDLLFSDRYKELVSGMLAYINVGSDPIEVASYLFDYGAPSVDFLFPLDNHDRRPPGKEDLDATPYADWLIPIFDYWWERGCPPRVRVFDSILQLLCGSKSFVESIGLGPVDLIVIETNGDLEGVDSLKATYDGATRLGFNIREQDFDTVARHHAVQYRQLGLKGLCEKCNQCPVVEICGGGYIPHRYSAENGFDNPSVYSADLEKLIRHIHATLQDAAREEALLRDIA